MVAAGTAPTVVVIIRNDRRRITRKDGTIAQAEIGAGFLGATGELGFDFGGADDFAVGVRVFDASVGEDGLDGVRFLGSFVVGSCCCCEGG